MISRDSSTKWHFSSSSLDYEREIDQMIFSIVFSRLGKITGRENFRPYFLLLVSNFLFLGIFSHKTLYFIYSFKYYRNFHIFFQILLQLHEKYIVNTQLQYLDWSKFSGDNSSPIVQRDAHKKFFRFLLQCSTLSSFI